MSDLSLKPLMIKSNKNLVLQWSIDTEQNFPLLRSETPKFVDPVDKIIYILEHENDPKSLTRKDLIDGMSKEIMQDVDREIVNALEMAVSK